jgi:hypothetical protein
MNVPGFVPTTSHVWFHTAEIAIPVRCNYRSKLISGAENVEAFQIADIDATFILATNFLAAYDRSYGAPGENLASMLQHLKNHFLGDSTLIFAPA